jgi:hypothetical protein
MRFVFVKAEPPAAPEFARVGPPDRSSEAAVWARRSARNNTHRYAFCPFVD